MEPSSAAPLPTASDYQKWEASQRPSTSVTTQELYDRWAPIYDSDGNILQAIDDLSLPPLLTTFFSLLPTSSDGPKAKLTELGCGTGRNTLKLLNSSLPYAESVESVVGLDLSPAMLSVARSAAAALPSPKPAVEFYQFNALTDPIPESACGADGVLSTLVLEHVPLDVFFKTVRGLLKDGGVLLLSNQHAEMGKMSEAGFLDRETGKKVQGGDHFVSEVSEVVEAAGKVGLRLVGEVVERRVEEGDRVALGGRGGKWVGVRVWCGAVFKLDSGRGD